MNALVQVENLVRYYGKQCAVREISFSVEAREVVGFLGPNGAGKTSTLNMISGNLAPSAGRVLINGVDIVLKPREAKSFLGYLPEVPPLYVDSTVDEYLLYCAKIHRIAAPRRGQCLKLAKQRCGLSTIGKRLIGNLSKGFRQRVGIAQAILHSPPLIILDEPSAGLDPIQIREMRELLRELGKDHGLILSSHILSEIRKSCTRTLVMHHGRIILDTDMAGLEQSLENANLVVNTRLPADIRLLQQIAGVDSIETLANNHYRIGFRKIHNPSEEIAETVVKAGWGLLQLHSEVRTIEELFLELIESDRPDERAAQA